MGESLGMASQVRPLVGGQLRRRGGFPQPFGPRLASEVGDGLRVLRPRVLLRGQGGGLRVCPPRDPPGWHEHHVEEAEAGQAQEQQGQVGQRAPPTRCAQRGVTTKAGT